MVDRELIGTWEVINCALSNFARCIVSEHDLNGIKFELRENGDVIWTVPEEIKIVPLFDCETYEYLTTNSSDAPVITLRFGACAGLLFEFKIVSIIPKKSMKLVSDSLCEMDCSYVDNDSAEDICNKVPFSFLSALDEGYFSDVTITASNKKQFKAHSIILALQANDFNWKSDPPPLNNLPEDVLGTILHFLYAEYLPENLTEATLKTVIETASSQRSLQPLVDNCQKYLKRIELKQEIIEIISDMHISMDTIVENMNPSSKYSQTESITSNPNKLYSAIKHSFREEVVAIAKFVLLCDIINKRKHELTSDEQDEILLLLKAEVPVYNNQFRKFLEGLKKVYRSMSPVQRTDVATFIIPEVEAIITSVLKLLGDAEQVFHHMICKFSVADVTCTSGDKLSYRLINMVQRTELRKLINIHENIKIVYDALKEKHQIYSELSTLERGLNVSRNLDILINKLPIFLIRLDAIVDVFDEKLELPEFKFFFKVETSKIAYVLQKLRDRLDISHDLIAHTCELIQRDAFVETLQKLELLEDSKSCASQNDTKKCDKNSSYNSAKYKLNLVRSLCVQPKLTNSALAHMGLKLFNEQKDTDMEFEILPGKSDSDNNDGPRLAEKVKKAVIIKAHRVIVAARCDWVRRALLSGMKESINRKIVIHDTNPFLFRILLEFLYSGHLNRKSLSTEQLVDLLTLSDKYEVDALKQISEHYLKYLVDAESIFYFLTLSDQYNARILKNKCFNFISQNSGITESEEFFDLSVSLQAEVFDSAWIRPKMNEFYFSSDKTGQANGIDDFFSFDQEVLRSQRVNHGLLETCAAQIRDIIGETVPRCVLKEVILAADYNLQRAINYYYSRYSQDGDSSNR